MNISIVIPNWNGKELLEKNLPEVLAAKDFKSNQISEVIIVDDGSTDESLKFLREHFDGQIKIIKHKANRGFSAAINTGVRSASGDLVCLLNTDVVPDKKFLKDVIPLFKEKRVFGVSLHESGYGHSIGIFREGYIVHDPGVEKNETTETFWISGGSGVFRRSTWINLKGLDEKLFSPFYWEDVDICYRALKRGYILLWEPRALVTHEHEVTVKKTKHSTVSRNLIIERNQLLFIWKNLTSRNLFRKHLSGLVARIAKHPGYLKVVLSALEKFPTVIRERRVEEKESTNSDEAIFSKF